MGKVNRREFFEELIATRASQSEAASNVDSLYDTYSNIGSPKKSRSASKTTASLSPYTGQWTDNEIIHLLRRTMFGVKYEDVLAFRNKTMEQAVDELLTPAPTPLPPVNDYNTSSYTDPHGIALGQTWINAPYDSVANGKRRLSVINWWIGLQVNQTRSITEKMMFFWHNHFATEWPVVAYSNMLYNHNKLLRENALGNFKTLVTKITTDPAMLRYLNGYLNTKTAPDENYARELFELFTLGKNYKPIYTEDDIKAAAKILTGWRYRTSDWSSYFNQNLHDTSDKQFSKFFSNTVIKGKTGAAGADETDELIDMIFQKQEAAKFIVRKLYRYFFYYDIDTQLEYDIIIPLAQELVFNGWEIKPIVEKLLKSQHFFDMMSQDCFIRTPIDFVVGTFRTFDIQIPSTFDAYKIGRVHNYLRYYMGLLGCEPGLPPNVAGWPAFYQEPDFYQKWINSTTMPRRMQFMDMMLGSGFSAGTGTAIKIDPMHFADKFWSPAEPNMLIDYMVDLLHGIGISKTLKDTYKISSLLSNQTSDHYWTAAWAQYVANPNTTNTNAVRTRLVSLLTDLTHLAEHQLC